MPAYLEQLSTTCPWSFYRVSVDLAPQFFSVVYNLNRALPFLKFDGSKPLSRPGCWAYPDMLMVGVSVPRHSGHAPHDPNLLDYRQWESHFAMWAITSSPLILGFDLTNETLLKTTWPIIANEEMLAISQVWRGHPGRLVANASVYKVVDASHGSPGTQFTTESLPSWQAWAKPVANGGVALLVVKVWEEDGEGISDAPPSPSSLSWTLGELFQAPTEEGRAPPTTVKVRDVLHHTNNGTATDKITVDLDAIPERGAVFLLLTPATASTASGDGVEVSTNLVSLQQHDFPAPTSLPPHSWKTVGDKLFLHGCNADGLFTPSALKLATRFSILTVEKGQGLALPGFADEKMAAVAAQWKAARRAAGMAEGWSIFYLNAKLDWTFYRLHAEMEAHSSWPIQTGGAERGEPCRSHGDPTFPQPADGLLCFNHSKAAVRAAFVAACVNATTPVAQHGGNYIYTIFVLAFHTYV